MDVDESDELFVVVVPLAVDEAEEEPPRKNPTFPNLRPKKLLLDLLAKASEEQQHIIHSVTTTIIRCKDHIVGWQGDILNDLARTDDDD